MVNKTTFNKKLTKLTPDELHNINGGICSCSCLKDELKKNIGLLDHINDCQYACINKRKYLAYTCTPIVFHTTIITPKNVALCTTYSTFPNIDLDY